MSERSDTNSRVQLQTQVSIKEITAENTRKSLPFNSRIFSILIHTTNLHMILVTCPSWAHQPTTLQCVCTVYVCVWCECAGSFNYHTHPSKKILEANNFFAHTICDILRWKFNQTYKDISATFHSVCRFVWMLTFHWIAAVSCHDNTDWNEHNACMHVYVSVGVCVLVCVSMNRSEVTKKEEYPAALET